MIVDSFRDRTWFFSNEILCYLVIVPMQKIVSWKRIVAIHQIELLNDHFFSRSYHTILIKPSLFWIVDIYLNFDIVNFVKIMTKLGFDESEWIRILNNGFKSSYTVLIVNLLSLDLINLEIGIMIYHVTTWSSPCRINYR